MNVRLQGERGDVVEEVVDIDGLLAQSMRPSNVKSYKLLKYIDPYGDTIFNRLQTDLLGSELKDLRKKSKNDQIKEMLD